MMSVYATTSAVRNMTLAELAATVAASNAGMSGLGNQRVRVPNTARQVFAFPQPQISSSGSSIGEIAGNVLRDLLERIKGTAAGNELPPIGPAKPGIDSNTLLILGGIAAAGFLLT